MSDQSPAVVSGSDYLRLPRAPETWLVEGLLPIGGSMLIFGDPKVGKSYAAMQLACCLASGARWLDFAVPQAVNVVYVQLDTPRALWADRMDKLAASGHPVEAVFQSDRDTLGTYPFSIMNPKHFRTLSDGLRLVKADVVIIDTLREATTGADENDSTETQEAVAYLEAAIKPAAMILVHHARKSGPDSAFDLKNDARGSNYVIGRMDAICRFLPQSVRFVSRCLDEQTIKLDREDDGTWILVRDSVQDVANLVISESGDISTRELAKIMHSRLPAKSVSACRAVIRRLLNNRPTFTSRKD